MGKLEIQRNPAQTTALLRRARKQESKRIEETCHLDAGEIWKTLGKPHKK